MPRITLNSTAFHGFSFSTGPKRGDGGPIVIAEFSAPWTEKNRQAGGWDELPETVSGNVNLIPAKLAATTITFKPGKGFEKHEFSIETSGATGFHCFCPTKEGEARELRFSVETSTKNAGRELDQFGRTCGSATGRLTISYDGAQDTLIDEQQALDTASDD